MAKVLGNLCAPTGRYLKDGEERTSWTKCGIVMETEKGLRVKMDVVPVGGTEHGIWFSVFPIEERGSQGSAPQRPSRASGEVSDQDNIPF